MRRARRAAGPPAPPGATTPAMEADGVWKAPGHHPPALRTFPHPLEILGARPPPAQDSTQLPQPRRRGHERDKEKRKDDRLRGP